MIVYDLTCSSGHEFEAWFKSADDFAKQSQQGLLSCPVCGDIDISKKLSTINIAGQKSNQNKHGTEIKSAQGVQAVGPDSICQTEGRQTINRSDKQSEGLVEQPVERRSELFSKQPFKQHAEKSTSQRMVSSEEVAVALRQFVEKNFDDVGNGFADEARKMHYGETDVRPIHGQASADEIADLSEEGIESVALPAVPVVSKH